uniref:Uncharacterized protein n=1 Tax=Aegilops tauschii subsp. strangulata TaxID=200361 RepID=A0A452YPF0_AEGTS
PPAARQPGCGPGVEGKAGSARFRSSDATPKGAEVFYPICFVRALLPPMILRVPLLNLCWD